MADAEDFSLRDRYTRNEGRVLLSGVQALVRLPLDLMRRDRAAGLNSGAFISGYRGSPLGGYDLELGRQRDLLHAHGVHFQPGVNEELAATAVWGSQQVNLFEGATVDGVCGIWYGKSPGVDRSTDAFRHGNAVGSSEYGGVLVVVGDDHGCKSSSYPGQSEFAFVDMHMPVLNPSSVQEVLDYGLFGIALSRYSGCWVAMITLAENMDSAATVDVGPERIACVAPPGHRLPAGGLNIRIPDTPLAQEERLWRYKRPAALAFCRHNGLNRVTLHNPTARLGIVTAGKAHLDFMQALDDLGVDDRRAQALGLRVLKVGMTYPLDVASIRDFARGLDYLFVIEEKRSLMEVQLKEELYNVEVSDPHFPRIIGKLDEHDEPLLPAYGELSPSIIAGVLARLLPPGARDSAMTARLAALERLSTEAAEHGLPQRQPFFCSGCPHNTSTRIPEGSRALAGIGCHYLAQGMNRQTYTFTQMGGEGVSWIGQAPFTKTPHVFVNLGDGTYFHSGILAVRAAVAAGVNVTYKILYNGAVAMTGGQAHDGELRPEAIARQLLAEGVRRVIWVTVGPAVVRGRRDVPAGIELAGREDLERIQRELRETGGVTSILYDQPCATELRRRRKRGLAPDPRRRVMINSRVCEGCGDCSVQSNCLSIEPLETRYGTKRQINQTSCNMDFSCIKGFCPSFVTVEGGRLREDNGYAADFDALSHALPEPPPASLERPFNLLITGVGGTGIVTVSALLATAAHLDGLAATTLDQTGLAQKGGAVYGHVRLARRREALHAVRISDASADAVLACDAVAATSREYCLAKLDRLRTRVVLNGDSPPTAAFVLGDDQPLDRPALRACLEARAAKLSEIDALAATRRAFGSTTTGNVFLLGYAWQLGDIPVTLPALRRAIELNGVQVRENLQAFAAGRLACVDGARFEGALAPAAEAGPAGEGGDREADLGSLVEDRSSFLTGYQSAGYAARYRELVARVAAVEAERVPGEDALARTVARYAFKLMAYKDEYEVARLHTDGDFRRRLEQQFEGPFRVTFHLAPPLLSRRDPVSGVPRKRAFGPWIQPLLRVLARGRVLRGTFLDPFGYSAERRKERALLKRYEATVEVLLAGLNRSNHGLACRIAALPDRLRGFGHVKARTLGEVEPRWVRLLGRFERGAHDGDDHGSGADSRGTERSDDSHDAPPAYIEVTQLPG